jgi:cytochrome c2
MNHRERPLWRLALAGAAAIVLVVIGIAIGVRGADSALARRVVARIQRTVGGTAPPADAPRTVPDVQEIGWGAADPVTSNLHYLQVAKLKLAPFETYGEGGALAEVAGHVLYASPLGQLGYLGRANVLHVIGTRVPMNLDGLAAHPVSRDPRFVMSYFRTLDLLVVPGPDGRFDLYASHHRFNADGCFEVVVSRSGGSATGDGLQLAGDWRDVFVAAPCMPPKEADLLWAGLESGGRLALRDPQTLLLTIGDHQFDGVRSEVAAAQDPGSDLGKVVAIDLPSGAARRLTSGHRNPQGLLVARDGTVWETEHGPQGGDEINVLREGANYGWPRVTYGREYGSRPLRDWPLNPEQGRHDGFELPAAVLVPSVGISNLIQPDPREWPLWRDHLLVISLGGLTSRGGGELFAARVERDGRIIYVERIPVPVEGKEKFRDIIGLADGRLAVITDFGNLLLFRNADAPATAASPREERFTVTLDPAAKAAAAAFKPPVTVAPEDAGRQLFVAKCAQCHGLDGKTRVGPPLNGIVGRGVGAFAGFAYSPGMKAAGGTWDYWALARYLQALEPQFAGSPMPQPKLSAQSARAVATYLATTE